MTLSSRISLRLPQLARQFGPDRLGGQAGLVVVPFAVQQVIRFGTSLVLSRLLAPEMLGLMMLINTLRTGTELLSDVGIGQSVVRSPRGDERDFLDTAWTLQVLRGVLLMAAAIAAAVPLGWIYGQPDIPLLILAASPVFLITGLQAPALFLWQRHVRLRTRAVFDMVCAVLQAVTTIGLAWLLGSVWALILGLLLAAVFSTTITFVIDRQAWPRFAWHREHLHEILHFGKWVFLATAIYFAASSYDRIYFVAALPLALAGVYSVARMFADTLVLLAQRAGNMLLFPKLALLNDRREEASQGVRAKRFRILALGALGLGLAIAASDRLILLCYDARYHEAAFMLPVMLVAVWVGVLSSFADAMLMGCGRPAPTAQANGAKFAALLIGLPWAVSQGGLFGALLVLILAEIARWLVLAPQLQKERLATIGDDLMLTALMVVAAVVAKVALGWLGIVPTPLEWWALGDAVHG